MRFPRLAGSLGRGSSTNQHEHRTLIYALVRGRAGRRVRIRSLLFLPSALLVVFAGTALAAATFVVVNATSVFQADPQGMRFNGNQETVIPSSVRQFATVTIPSYGTVQAWAGLTKAGGFCFALKAPNGTWAGDPLPSSLPASNGWDGGTVPGCFQTQQQQTLQGGGFTGQAVEVWNDLVRTSNGSDYVIYVGFAEAKGVAALVRDSATGVTAPVSHGGYYALAEPAPTTPIGSAGPPGGPSSAICGPCDQRDLEVYGVNGQILSPDYTASGMALGYAPGPTKGS